MTNIQYISFTFETGNLLAVLSDFTKCSKGENPPLALKFLLKKILNITSQKS